MRGGRVSLKPVSTSLSESETSIHLPSEDCENREFMQTPHRQEPNQQAWRSEITLLTTVLPLYKMQLILSL